MLAFVILCGARSGPTAARGPPSPSPRSSRAAARAACSQPGDKLVAVDGAARRHSSDADASRSPRTGAPGDADGRLRGRDARDASRSSRDGQRAAPRDHAGLRRRGRAHAARLHLRRDHREPPGRSRAPASIVGEMWTSPPRPSTTIAGIFNAEKRKQISGVVGSYEDDAPVDRVSSTRALYLLAIISLSLGVDQPVPVPAARRRAHLLGAGREGPRPGDPVRVMERAGFVGFVLVIVLFVIGFTNDIGRLTRRGLRGPIASGHMEPSSRAPVAAATIAEAFRITAERPSPTASRSAPRTTRSR